MFYSHDILHRRGGKFGIVWLAATKFTSVSLSRREYFTVSVSKTCDDIMKYICLDAQPLKPHGARPRLSLYLSSQLMFGVTRVYRRQIEYLSAEVLELYMRFSSTKLTWLPSEKPDVMQIALQKQYRTSEFCTLEDPLKYADDSGFGVMKFLEEREIDPSCLPHIDYLPEESPVLPAFALPDQFPSPGQIKMDEMLRLPHTVSSSSEISLKEFPELPILPIQDDLMPLEEPVEDLMEQMELAVETLKETTQKEDEILHVDELPRVPSPLENGAKTRKERKPAEKKTVPDVSALPDVTRSPLEERPVIPPEPATPKVPTPISVLHLSPLLELPDVTSPRRHGRRRQLSFHDVVDDHTELSKQYIRNNMATSNDLCYSSAHECLPLLPRPTANELLTLPGRKSLTKNKILMNIWRSRAVRYRGRVVPSEDSEPWSTKYLKAKPDKDVSSTTEASPELPRVPQDTMEGSPEKLRDISAESAERPSRIYETPSLLTISDISRLSESGESIQPPSFQLEPAGLRQKGRLTEQSIQEEQAIEEAGPLDTLLQVGSPPDIVPALPEDLLEEPQEIAAAPASPEISSSDKEDQTITIPHQNIIRKIAELTSVAETMTFKDLVPITSSCNVAGKVFSVCLEYAALKLIVLQQTFAYGDIYIKRGELF